jgi:hypothetical protein
LDERVASGEVIPFLHLNGKNHSALENELSQATVDAVDDDISEVGTHHKREVNRGHAVALLSLRH